MDALAYFRAEIDTVGRKWRDLLVVFDERTARHRPAENINHALWLTGHMIWAEDFFVFELPVGRSVRRRDWDELFDCGSEKQPPEAYPPFAEVREEYYRVHKAVNERLSEMSHKDLLANCVKERRWFASAAHSIAHQAVHGYYHLGQFHLLNRLRRAGASGF